jgi:hypothetical protein
MRRSNNKLLTQRGRIQETADRLPVVTTIRYYNTNFRCYIQTQQPKIIECI